MDLSTQMNEKKVQIKKYNILSRFIEELYSKNKNFLDDYLSPFKKKNKNIIKFPFFIFIITTNSDYNYFKISSKKFLEDSDSNYECKLFVYYVRFKLNGEVNNINDNNEDLKFLLAEIKELKGRVKKLEYKKNAIEKFNELFVIY